MRPNARMPLAALAAALALVTATPRPAVALYGVEALTSTVFQQEQSSFAGIGLRMRVVLPQLVEGFSLMPAIEYWRNQSTLEAFDIEATRKDGTLATFLRYDFKREGWHPYLGAGLGLHFLSSEVDAPSLGLDDASDSLTKGGIAVLGGVSFGITGKLGNLIELEHHFVPDHSQLKINWGLSYEF